MVMNAKSLSARRCGNRQQLEQTRKMVTKYDLLHHQAAKSKKQQSSE